MKFHFEPPKEADFRTEEEFLDALAYWEKKEDEYWDELND